MGCATPTYVVISVLRWLLLLLLVPAGSAQWCVQPVGADVPRWHRLHAGPVPAVLDQAQPGADSHTIPCAGPVHSRWVSGGERGLDGRPGVNIEAKCVVMVVGWRSCWGAAPANSRGEVSCDEVVVGLYLLFWTKLNQTVTPARVLGLFAAGACGM